MRKRELLLGFGAGMIVAAAVTGWFQTKQMPSAQKALSSEQIKKAAEELEMVVLSKEEYEQWQQEKKVNVKPAPEAPKAPATPQAGQTVKPQSPTSTQPASPNPPVSGVQTTIPQTTSPTNGATSPAEQVKSPVQPNVETPVVKKQISFTVPYKATAEGVAKKLVAEGILPPDNTLVEELRSQDKLNRIRVGTYQITTPATAADIVKLITTPPQK
ncbi:DNA polymerase III subunit gamma/tau [Brevibacillus nitrificans]|uniref:DNA polymerase III subunit gamma/tau n=1 Tax=Brevibacillus nitrificans TaxID=651560 RepID=UPI002612858A|nr:DNA polymerase III subunit gamma/tau [Brevibacillus nitrificans]